MKTIQVKFNSTESQSYFALKNNTAPIISYHVVVQDLQKYSQTGGRVETPLDKVSRDISTYTVSSIDFEAGYATIVYTGQDEIITHPMTRLFINALTANGVITAITGFTAAGTY